MEHKEYHRQVFETIFTQFDTEVPSYSLIDNDIEEILKEIETKFWANHERIKANLTEEGLLPGVRLCNHQITPRAI